MKEKILILLVSMALLVGVLSGCTEEETPAAATNTAPTATVETPVVTHNTTAAGGTVQFNCTATDADEGDTIAYTWDFGDDGTSTQEDPEHTYATNGSYAVTVTVTDGTDSYTTDVTTVLVGNQAPVASFTHVADNLTVTFTDASTDDGTVSTWAWDFGDDNTSAVQAPEAHIYAANGTYTVTLTVTDEYGVASTADTEDITVAQEVAV